MPKTKPRIKEIYVADISFDVVEEDIRKLFSVCGTVRAIHMLNDPGSGQFSGRAYVRMATDAETKDAINTLDGTLLINRCIRVSAAREKNVPEPIAPLEQKQPRRRRQPKGRRKK
jgi:RNA recognition motif-containing protein